MIQIECTLNENENGSFLTTTIFNDKQTLLSWYVNENGLIDVWLHNHKSGLNYKTVLYDNKTGIETLNKVVQAVKEYNNGRALGLLI